MPGASRPRILIADDHALIAEAFHKLLANDFDVVAIVHDGRTLIDVAQHLCPDVLLIDVGMPVLNGLEAGQRIKRILPNVKIIYVTINNDSDLVAEAFRLGASAYLPKNSAPSELLTAIRTAMEGHQYISPLLSGVSDNSHSRPPDDFSHPQLTDRQFEVLQLLAEGRSMKEVASVLNLTTRTVAFHKYRIMESLHLRNDAEVVQYAMRRHIIFS